MKHSLTTIALGALLLSQSVLAGLYSSKDNVIDVTPKNFQAEVMDSNVCRVLPHSPTFVPALLLGIEVDQETHLRLSSLSVSLHSMLSWSSFMPLGAVIAKSKESHEDEPNRPNEM